MLPRHSHTCPLQVFTSRAGFQLFPHWSVGSQGTQRRLCPSPCHGRSQPTCSWQPQSRNRKVLSIIAGPSDQCSHTESTKACNSFHWTPWGKFNTCVHSTRCTWLQVEIWDFESEMIKDEMIPHFNIVKSQASKDSFIQSVGLRDVANPHLPCRILSRSCVIKNAMRQWACQNQLLFMSIHSDTW